MTISHLYTSTIQLLYLSTSRKSQLSGHWSVVGNKRRIMKICRPCRGSSVTRVFHACIACDTSCVSRCCVSEREGTLFSDLATRSESLGVVLRDLLFLLAYTSRIDSALLPLTTRTIKLRVRFHHYLYGFHPLLLNCIASLNSSPSLELEAISTIQ